ncbi:MAG: choice-of-anchor D domain-containing protein [Myxococcota bacterium]|nr:choice-of-anchor D domain-containing protein [Myxococcota bacterium]
MVSKVTLGRFIGMLWIMGSWSCTPSQQDAESGETPAETLSPMAGTTGDSMRSGGVASVQMMGGSESVGQGQPTIAVLPDMIEFIFSASDDPDPQTFTIENRGSTLLTIRTLRLERQAGQLSTAFQFVDMPETPIRLMPSDSIDISIRYVAPDATARTANFVIESDDPNRAYLRQRVSARALVDTVTISPSVIDLGQVPVGTLSGEFNLAIKNGDRPHTIDTLTLEAGAGFLVDAEDGEAIDGRTLGQGEQIRLLIKYDNRDGALADGVARASTLTVTFVDDSSTPLTATLRATGAPNGNCQVIVTTHVPETPFLMRSEADQTPLDRLDLGYVRINTTVVKTLDVTNTSGVPCRIKATTIEAIRQDEMGENLFEMSALMNLTDQVLGPMQTGTLEISYSPKVEFIQGDEWRIKIAYNADSLAATATNLTYEMSVFGVGSPALLGHTRDTTDVNFFEVTATPIEGVRAGTCASSPTIIKAENVGFVPFCIREYRLEGDDCGAFLMTSMPTIEGDCFEVTRMPARAAEFVFQFQPVEPGMKACTFIVVGDTDGQDDLRFELLGTGSETDQTTEVHVMGDVDRRRKQTWDLKMDARAETVTMNWVLPADEDADRVEMTGQTVIEALDRQDNTVDMGRTKKILVRPADLPVEGASLDIMYDRWCFDPQ